MLILAAALLSPVALAEDGPYMWGVGPSVGTVALPFEFPTAFPKITVTDANGDESKERLDLEQTKGDVYLGAKGALYINRSSRLVGRAGFGVGSAGYRSGELTGEYQFMPVSENNVDAFLGLGAGFGKMHWQTYCPDDTEVTCVDTYAHPGDLSFSNFLLRGSAGGMYRTRNNGFELSAFLQLVLGGAKEFTPQGDAVSVEASGGFYPYVGVEGTVYFGDFKPPGEGGKKKKKGNNG